MHLKNSHTGLGSQKSKLTALELVKEGATILCPPPTKLGLKVRLFTLTRILLGFKNIATHYPGAIFGSLF